VAGTDLSKFQKPGTKIKLEVKAVPAVMDLVLLAFPEMSI
jgi:hypothetical protein